MQPLLTNAEWSHIIDALQEALKPLLAEKRNLDHLIAEGNAFESHETRRTELVAQIARYRQLRGKLLAEERKA